MKKNITVIIIEDEPRLKKELITLIKEYLTSFDIIGVYDNCEAALHGIEKLSACVFLVDIGLPEKDGFTFVNEVNAILNTLPYIVFMSADDHKISNIYSTKGIIIDILLKPISIDRLLLLEQRVQLLLNI